MNIETGTLEGQSSRFLKRLGAHSDLSEPAARQVQALLGNRMRLRRGGDFIKDGKPVPAIFVVESGWAMRYVLTSEGRRQILNVALPGDVVGFHSALIGKAQFDAAALGDSVVCMVEPDRLFSLLEDQPAVSRAMNRLAASELTGLRAQTLRLGRLTAEQRIAHFLSELWVRLGRVGEVADGWSRMPMTQTDISDTLGLSLVHTNRQLQELKRNGLIALRRDRFSVLDSRELARIGDFAPL